MLNILLTIGMWFVGVLLYSFGVLQILISLFCTIPATKMFSKGRFVDTGRIYRRCSVTILTWIVIAGGIIYAVLRFCGPYARVGFFAGMAITALLSLGRVGMNADNIVDYFRVYGTCYAPKDLCEILGEDAPNQPTATPALDPEEEDALRLVSHLAEKNGTQVLEYIQICMAQEKMSSGIPEDEARRQAARRASEPVADLAYELVVHYASKNQMTVPEYIDYCDELERNASKWRGDAPQC